MFVDNKYLVDSAIHPHENLYKRHNELYFNQYQGGIEYKMLAFYHVSGGGNPSNILSKNWRYSNIWVLLHPRILWMRGNMDLLYFLLRGAYDQSK